jgi:PEGA domain
MPEANAHSANIVFFSLAEFGVRPVAEQAQLKETLDAALAAAIAPVPVAERIVLETREGAAVVLLDGPVSALDLGNRVRTAAPALPLSIGINHGPVKLTLNGGHGPVLFGDGLAAGAAIAGYAQPGATLVSRSFREALADSAPDRAESLQPAGVFTDAAVRSHEVFAPGRKSGAFRRRRLLVFGTLGVAGILAAGVVARRARQRALASARTPAVVALAITPGGEVLVDGQVRGMTPPLKALELAPGRHTIVVRTGAHAPLTTQVELGPGERYSLRHDFPPPAPPPVVATTPAPAKPITSPATAPAKSQKSTPAPATTTTTTKKPPPGGRNVKEDFRQAGREMRDFFRGLVR